MWGRKISSGLGTPGADLELWGFVLPPAQAFGEKETRRSLMETQHLQPGEILPSAGTVPEGKEPEQLRIEPDWAQTCECNPGRTAPKCHGVGNQLLMPLKQAPE